MVLSTDDPTLTALTALTTLDERTARPAPVATLRSHGRRNAVLGWAGVGIAVAAVAGLAVAVLRPDTSTPVHDNVGTVVAHGSVAAVDHRDQVIVAGRTNTPSQTAAHHGSVAAADHRDQVVIANRINSPSQTAADHGSVAAIEHRDALRPLP